MLRKRKNELAMTAQKAKKRDCFGNKEDDLAVTLLIGHSEPRSGEESLRRDCFADETTSSQ